MTLLARKCICKNESQHEINNFFDSQEMSISILTFRISPADGDVIETEVTGIVLQIPTKYIFILTDSSAFMISFLRWC